MCATHAHVNQCVCVRVYSFFIRTFGRVEISHISVLRWFNFIYILPFLSFFLYSLCMLNHRSDWQYIGMHRCICKRYNAHRHQHIHREFSHCRPSCDYTVLATHGGMGRYWNMVCDFFLHFLFSYVFFFFQSNNRIEK